MIVLAQAFSVWTLCLPCSLLHLPSQSQLPSPHLSDCSLFLSNVEPLQSSNLPSGICCGDSSLRFSVVSLRCHMGIAMTSINFSELDSISQRDGTHIVEVCTIQLSCSSSAMAVSPTHMWHVITNVSPPAASASKSNSLLMESVQDIWSSHAILDGECLAGTKALCICLQTTSDITLSVSCTRDAPGL